MANASIVFPRPPPTYNTLSQAQRAQLLRSSAKLGQILGSTPHILDDTDASPISPPTRSSSLRSTRSPSVASTASTSSTRSAESGHSERSWRARFPACKPPLLRIGKVAPTAPAPHRGVPPQAHQAVRAPPAGSPDSSPGSSPREPTFSISSDTTLKRQKMRRIAKKLGEGVPVHLVFPPTAESDEDEVFVDSPMSTCAPHYRYPSASASVSSASDRGSEESADETRSWEEKHLLWEKQTTRRSKFARASTVLSGRYVVHYHDEDGVHGRGDETFGILPCGKFAAIPEEDGGIGYAL
ncbi:uncharacterized protein PHACADRAFT_259423 [Phanerochaete carnosa HHB-10118-sp]|uniref:Uncharacterized protein n=1 Tax=Phanerochaete carnosa (strain HHB-10118-sp) TaxID=650164 RepID=K5UTE2_PHACS|nr:uncharacterized protein PHACADRAFT_259423 [Phanerochaete carnosa HHB-10118-sp]EKM53221.1 hypothetical protein PHACADRAFT_259423 [Phanerochaete carnosa HHB-10118-sp]